MVLGKEAPANSVPAAAVTRRVQALIGITGRKGHVGGLLCENKTLENAFILLLFRRID